MKKLIIILGCLIFLSFGTAYADSKTWTLYLGASAVTPTQTAPASGTGVSRMVVEGNGINRSQGITVISGLDQLVGSTWVCQLVGVDSWPKTASGTTVSIWYKESIESGETYFRNSGTTTAVYDKMALSSGTSLDTVTITPVGMGGIEFTFRTEGSPISGVSMRFRAYDERK